MLRVYTKREIREVSHEIGMLENVLQEEGLRQDTVDTELAQCLNPSFLKQLIAKSELRLTAPRENQVVIVHTLRDDSGRPYYLALRGDSPVSADRWQLAQLNRRENDRVWHGEE